MNINDIVFRTDIDRDRSYVQRALLVVHIAGEYATVMPEGETYSHGVKLDALRLATPDEIAASRAFAHALDCAWRAQEAMREARLTIPWGIQVANVPAGVARIEARIAKIHETLDVAAMAWRKARAAFDALEVSNGRA